MAAREDLDGDFDFLKPERKKGGEQIYLQQQRNTDFSVRQVLTLRNVRVLVNESAVTQDWAALTATGASTDLTPSMKGTAT